MRHLQHRCVRQEMIVNPAREDRRFHRRRPGLRKCFHPFVQIAARGGNRAFRADAPASVLNTVADRFLVNVQTDVIHFLHGEPPWLYLNQRVAEFS